jgi:hypothetical protein
MYNRNRRWVDTRWQQYSTHLHTNSTQNTENGTYITIKKLNIHKAATTYFAVQSVALLPFRLHFVGCCVVRGRLTSQSLAVISLTTRFNIQKIYAVLTLLLSVLYGLVSCTTIRDRVCITEERSVYCAVRNGSLYKMGNFRL